MARDLRAVHPVAELIAAAIAAVLIASPSAAAQARSAYDALVDQYAAGDAKSAVLALGEWKGPAIANASANESRHMSAQRQRAAVMLHTDTAFAFLVLRATADASMHLTAARRILSAMKGAGRVDERTQLFERRWFAFTASMYTAQGRLDQAALIVRDGLGLYPRDAMLHVARGSIREMDVALTAVDPGNGRHVNQVARGLEAAAADYRRAIDYDSTLALAHVHLGWVRFAGHDDRCVHDFEAALEHATDDMTRYLSHLFLGALAERQNRLEDARTQYEAAMQVGAAYQTAYVALSRIEEALGHSGRAQELARAYAALPSKSEDPWWDYRFGGFHQPMHDWLRREAITP